mmetsp:Transcript_25586/g.56016  ORF Transcript_25586/g.56016 Transcript_25586/m.56016 type:complete len:311 (+) Transcript_25586:575-1507(+)
MDKVLTKGNSEESELVAKSQSSAEENASGESRETGEALQIGGCAFRGQAQQAHSHQRRHTHAGAQGYAPALSVRAHTAHSSSERRSLRRGGLCRIERNSAASCVCPRVGHSGSSRRVELRSHHLLDLREHVPPLFDVVDGGEGGARDLEARFVIPAVALHRALHDAALERVLQKVLVELGRRFLLLEGRQLVSRLAAEQLHSHFVKEGDVARARDVVAQRREDPAPRSHHRLVALLAVALQVELVGRQHLLLTGRARDVPQRSLVRFDVRDVAVGAEVIRHRVLAERQVLNVGKIDAPRIGRRGAAAARR